MFPGRGNPGSWPPRHARGPGLRGRLGRTPFPMALYPVATRFARHHPGLPGFPGFPGRTRFLANRARRAGKGAGLSWRSPGSPGCPGSQGCPGCQGSPSAQAAQVPGDSAPRDAPGSQAVPGSPGFPGYLLRHCIPPALQAEPRKTHFSQIWGRGVGSPGHPSGRQGRGVVSQGVHSRSLPGTALALNHLPAPPGKNASAPWFSSSWMPTVYAGGGFVSASPPRHPQPKDTL